MTVVVTETFTGSNGSGPPSPWIIPAGYGGTQNIQSNQWHILEAASFVGSPMTYGSTTYTDVDITVTVTLDSGGAEQYPLIGARMSGGTNGWGTAADISTGYGAYLNTVGDTLGLYTATAGTLSPDISVNYTLTAGQVHKIRLQCVGTTVRAKAWLASGAEPAYWMISYTDATSASGLVGFRGQALANTTTCDFDDFVLDDQPAGPYKAQTIGTQVTNAAALTTVINYAGSVKPQVGDLVVMYGSRDNILNDPATADTFTDSQSNTWNLIGRASPAGTSTASAGIVGIAFWSTITTAWAAGTNVLTWNHPSTKAAMVMEHWRGTAGLRGSITAGSTAGAPSAALTGVLSGDVVLAMEAIEYSTAGTSTADTDTTNGNWSTLLGPTATTGTTLAAVKVISQYKIVSADGTQTYNPTHSVTASVDAVAIVMAFIASAVNLSRYPPPRAAVQRAATV